MGIYMIIKEKEIVTILKHACNQFFNFKDITISNMEVEVGSYITVEARVNYYNVDTKLKAVAKIECEPKKVIIHTRGIIKYGFINLDFNKVMNDYLQDNDYLHVTKDGLVLKNEYVQDITYGNGQIEIELK
jgi:hypothetical protein